MCALLSECGQNSNFNRLHDSRGILTPLPRFGVVRETPANLTSRLTGNVVPLPRFGVVRETPANLTSRPAGNVAPLLPYGLSSPVSPPHRKCFRRGPRNEVAYSQNAGLTLYEYQNFWYRTHITKRKTVPTEIPARFTPPKILSAGAPRGGIRRSHTYARVYLGIRIVRRD